MTTAREFLDQILSSEQIEGAARASHAGWYAVQEKKLNDPANPFQGFGEKRVRVRDLTAEQRTSLGIAENADPSADVYNPAFTEFDKLPSAIQNKNVMPLAALALFLGGLRLHDEKATLDELRQAIQELVDGSAKNMIYLVSMLQHVGFTCGAIAQGERGHGPSGRTDMKCYPSLNADVAALDSYTLLPAAKWLGEQLGMNFAS